jgi:hypothetical protein
MMTFFWVGSLRGVISACFKGTDALPIYNYSLSMWREFLARMVASEELSFGGSWWCCFEEKEMADLDEEREDTERMAWSFSFYKL